jgi:predicted 3-demethylubiquinone-9 3-methyltransferase (glyoxalase superfamily)
MKPITPCLWFDGNAEEAVYFYGGIFEDFKIAEITRYTKAGHEIHGMKEGTVMTVAFELNGQPFLALNGGPMFKFTEAISFQIHCDTQEEIDRYWEHLGAGGDPEAKQCGWLKDRFGVSWQVLPASLPALLKSGDPAVAERTMRTLLGMKKIEIAALERAREG